MRRPDPRPARLKPAVEPRDYRTLATREPVAVVPEVEAWRRKAGRDKRWRKALAVLITAPFVVSGVMTLAVALAVANPLAAGVGLLLAAFGTLLTVYELHQARWEREVRIVLRLDRPRAVPTRAHYFGSALAASWSETVARAEAPASISAPSSASRTDALGVTNPEVFLAIASDNDRWFPVHEGLAVFGPLANAWLPGTRERADLARIVAMLASAPPSAGNDAPSPIWFRLEYVDGRDPRTGNELFATGYCVAQTADLRA